MDGLIGNSIKNYQQATVLSDYKSLEPWEKPKCAEAFDREMVTSAVVRKKIPIL
jgi:hypothetical protein